MKSILHEKTRSLYSLCIGEFCACIIFIFCLYMFSYRNIINIDYAVIYPFISLLIILLQGSYYWYYKLRIIKKRNPDRIIFRKTYKVLKRLDFIMFILYPIGLIYLLILNDICVLRKENFFGTFLFVFGIIEYINYFYIRLSYSKHEDIVALFKFQNIKKSSLGKELEKNNSPIL